MPRTDPQADWPVPPELRVTDPAAIELLWHPARRMHLRPYLGRSCGLAQAAQLLGVGKTAMSYWQKRLLAVGLIRPRGTERQGARQVPVYRCVADGLRVNLRHVPHASLEAVFDDSSAVFRQAAHKALTQAFARQAPWLDLVVRADPATGMGTELAPQGRGAPPDDYLHYWGRLWLAPDEAQALRTELDALWERYAALSDQRGKRSRMLLHLMAVPERPARAPRAPA